jgi:predicted DNA-binding WGR domain protein
MMSTTLLHRVNQERNEARFYLVIVGASLLDEHAVMRVWGRIGGYQRAMVTPCASAEEAEKLAGRLIRKRMRHGYSIVEF